MVPEFTRPILLLLLPAAAAALIFLCPARVRRSLRGRISMGMHALIALLLILSLAGFSLNTPSRDHVSYLILDRSASAPEDEVLSLAQAALSAAPQEEVGVIVFGQNALVEKNPAAGQTLTGIQSGVNPDGSNLTQALGLGRALLSESTLGGLAVISDGLTETPSYSSLPVNVLIPEAGTGADVQVSDLSVPSLAYAGQKLNLEVTLDSTAAGTATVYLYQNDEILASRDVQLYRGQNRFSFSADPSDSALTAWKARVQMSGDSVPENNERGAFTRQMGRMRVLLVESRSGDAAELKSMLSSAGMDCETLPATALPSAPEDLLAWQALCLVNLDLGTVREESLQAMITAVRDFGLGLVTFGGDSTYALGGFRGSDLEQLLPVTMDVRNRAELPSTALILVIDQSGSMSDAAWGVTRLDVAKQAAAEAVSVLTEKDSIGVIAFDDAGQWVWPLSPLSDPEGVRSAIGSIRPGGGTAFYTPLAMALNALSQTEAAYRHVIFLTDGESGDTGYEQIVESMAREGITLTTVAVGDGADHQTMLRLARIGHGRAYSAGQFDNLPRIFAKETMMVAQNYIQNRTFTPAVTDSSLTDFSGFPVLDGYLASTEKDTATVSLISDRGDPILAWWQPGKGRVVSFMSDVQGGWTRSFLAWEDAPAFFAGLVAHVLPADDSSGHLELDGHTLVYTAPVTDDGAVCRALLSSPQGQALSLELNRTGAATYAAELPSTAASYAVSLSLVKDDEVLAHLESGIAVPYSAEYDLRRQDTEALRQLALSSGGRVVSSPAELLDFPPRSVQARQDLSGILLPAALMLFLIDIAQRRLLRASPTRRKESAQAEPEEAKKAKKPKQIPASSDKTHTTDTLFEQMQKRKKL